jgi:hypothetical protein
MSSNTAIGIGITLLAIIWLWCVYDIVTHDRMTAGYKAFWVLFTLVLPLLGTLIWIGKRPPRVGDNRTGYFSQETNTTNL